MERWTIGTTLPRVAGGGEGMSGRWAGSSPLERRAEGQPEDPNPQEAVSPWVSRADLAMSFLGSKDISYKIRKFIYQVGSAQLSLKMQVWGHRVPI